MTKTQTMDLDLRTDAFINEVNEEIDEIDEIEDELL